MDTPLIFILCWERPLYLWACLDSLYRNTPIPRRFVLIDNASRDPLVSQVIRAFEARGLFHRVHRRSENSPDALAEAVAAHLGELGGYFGYIESDVLVPPSEPCWLQRFLDITAANPDIGMLGSLVDKTDFVDRDWAAKRFPQLSAKQIFFLVKPKSPERNLKDSYAEPLIDPFNPPGRLLFLKTEMIKQTGILRDSLLYEECKRLGYRACIATGVKHRHLSFQNIFDYPGTDNDTRTAFFKAMQGEDGK